MTTYREKFRGLLRDEILKLDLAELDFGIYRILKYHHQKIEQFLDQDLPVLIAEAIGHHGQTRLEEVRVRLRDLEEKLNKAAQALGLSGAFLEDGSLRPAIADTPYGQEYRERSDELRHLEAEAGFTQPEEENLYNHLFTFFRRYYRDGDFQPQMRRSSRVTFTVPYRGEDVHFYWRGYGNHYVKTTEELKRYQLLDHASGWRVRFELVDADVEQDNAKGRTRYFFPVVEDADADSEQTRTFVLPFAFRLLTEQEAAAYGEKGERIQDQILNDAMGSLKAKLPKDVDLDKVAYHMRRYARKHRSDYFTFPRLGSFLRDELDYYLKAEFLQAGALTDPEALSDRFIKYRALEQIGHAIIDLFEEIELFQAQLFQKRKFVVKTSYLIPVRFLSRDLWLRVLQEDAQIDAWRGLFAVEGAVTEDTLATHPTLVVDTRYFDSKFTLEALAGFADLDEAVDGILIHGENYAALRTLEPKFRGKVTVCYIDPPYNTGSDDFLYKDDFSRHSTWLAMMTERLHVAREWLSDSQGIIFISIDDNEYANLKQAADQVFGPDNFVTNVIWQKVFAPKNTAKYFSEDHDYLLVYAKRKDDWQPYLLPRSEEADARYTNLDGDTRGLWASDNLLARNYYSKGEYEVVSPAGKAFRNPTGTYWRISKAKFQELDDDDRIWWGEDGGNMPRLKRFLSEVKPGIVPQTLWKHEEVGNTQEAKKELLSVVSFARTEDVLNTVKPTRLIHRVLHIGTTPEIPAWIVDFFAGSGTTGHAVISLNREDGGQRRFVLVEMGEYFEQLTCQRIIRAMYTPDWRDGKPEVEPVFGSDVDQSDLPGWVERSPKLVKVLRLESYEDSLNALEMPEQRDRRLQGQLSLFTDELHYCFQDLADGSLVTLNTEALERPFDYKLRVHTPDGENTLDVDLVETANLLLGLHVQRTHELYDGERRYMVIEAQDNGTSVLVVWRSIDELDPEHEREFLRKHFDLDAYDAIYTNADSPVRKGSVILDRELKERMMEPDPGVVQ